MNVATPARMKLLRPNISDRRADGEDDDGGRDHVNREHPSEHLVAIQVREDAGDRSGDDGLIEGAYEERSLEREDEQKFLPPVKGFAKRTSWT